MGQKVHPIIFRQALSNPQICSWFSKKLLYPKLHHQDLEIRNFLISMLRSRGILLRSCKVIRSPQKLLVNLDLYFSYLFSKRAKSSWATDLFKTLKKKYLNLNRIKDLKFFLNDLNIKENFLFPNSIKNFKRSSFVQRKVFLDREKSFSINKKDLDYDHRFFFFLLVKEKEKLLFNKKKKMSILGIVKKAKRIKIVRLNLSKLKKLFIFKKLKYSFAEFFTKKLALKHQSSSSSLLTLNKTLCKSLQYFTGSEKVSVRLFSNQLCFLPSLKVYYYSLVKELSFFQRNRNLKGFFFETLEIFYFVLGTFSYGNANLLAKYISFLLENTRKHTFIVKFIKKIVNLCFENLPSNFLAVNGIKILIKGRLNKRKRTKTFLIDKGQIALQTLQNPLDYCQTHAVTLYGTFGVKVWLSKSVDFKN
jgi:hypothetical protein